MQNPSRWLFLIAVFLLAASDCSAEQIRAYVAPFAVTGVANSAELKGTIQNLLMSRLGNATVIAVESAELADINIKGSYVAFGKVFSIDSVAKSSSGKVLVRAFEQGESQEDMLLAIGKLAQTLLTGIDKNYQNVAAPASPAVTPPTIINSAAPKVEKLTPPSDVVRSATIDELATSGWISQKLEGELVGMAIGRSLGNNEREVFIAGQHSLHYFLQGKELKLMAEITVPVYQKIIAIDTADLDSDGIQEIYLTIMSGEDLVSEVWTVERNSLKKIGDKLPYFFRAVSFQGQGRKIFAQQTGRDAVYFGDMHELTKKGSVFAITNPLKLPKGANIYNSAIFLNKAGKSCFAVMDQDGYLQIYDEAGKNLWKSSDKYGGTETFFSRGDLADMQVTGSPQRKFFLEQRVTVNKSGEIIVPKNDGFFVIGNNRSYSKNSVFAFAWNGVMLDELWHTKQSQNYLADYYYDEKSKELLLLEVVKKAGIVDKGASAVLIKKVE